MQNSPGKKRKKEGEGTDPGELLIHLSAPGAPAGFKNVDACTAGGERSELEGDDT